ncbi:PEGA domain family protein [Ectocarpus siliculosus]|uniref:PEGA domain family protein n=1 Tax=Ectocarpus siliculosus TaxID=2880 RepID=D8LAU1_ECTSI|nr:PEGA domain family protein [Ectocarpus siliculosus]|eukprot:CBN76450.1 PEGA domain family protein [Ectocarpus siliculosus]
MATEEWYWQAGTAETDYLNAVLMGSDGSSVLAGLSFGLWNGTNADTSDASLRPAATKLDADGNILWKWQHDINAFAAAAGEGRSVVTAGFASGGWEGTGLGFVDFTAVSLDADSGELLWKWQDGSEGFDVIYGATLADEGESVVMAGYTSGNFSGVNAGSNDFVAIKLNFTDGSEVWRWQDGTDEWDQIGAVAETADGTGFVLVGSTQGDWDGDNAGNGDFAVVMLDVDGNESWRWQDGTTEQEWLVGVAVQDDGSILLAGQQMETTGDESVFFTALKLQADGEEVTWRWQGGNAGDASRLYDMAAGADGKMILAGYTDGSWEDGANLGADDFLAVMLNTIATTPAPSSPGGDTVGGPTAAPSTPAAATPATSSPGGDAIGGPTGAPSLPATTTPGTSSASDSPTGGLTAAPLSDGSASSTAPIIAGALSTAAFVALSAVGFLLRRRRAAKKNGADGEDPHVLPLDGLEDGRQHEVSLSKSAVIDGGGNPTLHQENHSPPANHVKSVEAAASGGGAAATLNTSQPIDAGKVAGVALADGSAEDYLAKQHFVVATTSTADASTLDRAAVAGIFGEEAEFWADGPKPASSAAGRRGSCSDVGVGRAVMNAAQELAQRCQIPGVSEAAAMVSILVNLVTDSRDSNNKGDATLKQCRSVVMALERAATVAGEVGVLAPAKSTFVCTVNVSHPTRIPDCSGGASSLSKGSQSETGRNVLLLVDDVR